VYIPVHTIATCSLLQSRWHCRASNKVHSVWLLQFPRVWANNWNKLPQDLWITDTIGNCSNEGLRALLVCIRQEARLKARRINRLLLISSLSQVDVSLRRVDVAPHTQFLARCSKLNNLKCSSVVRLFCSGNDVYLQSQQHGDQFSTSSVEQCLTLVTSFFAFWCVALLLLGISVKVRRDNVNFCVHNNECLLTKNIYLLWFTSA